MTERGWFADIDEDGGSSGFVWQPYLETGHGVVPTLSVWFVSREDCEDFIREHLVDVGVLND